MHNFLQCGNISNMLQPQYELNAKKNMKSLDYKNLIIIKSLIYIANMSLFSFSADASK
jgi:hypothetical protein